MKNRLKYAAVLAMTFCLLANSGVGADISFADGEMIVENEGAISRFKTEEMKTIYLAGGAQLRISVLAGKNRYRCLEIVSKGTSEFTINGQNVKLFDGGSYRAKITTPNGMASLDIEWDDAEVSETGKKVNTMEVLRFFSIPKDGDIVIRVPAEPLSDWKNAQKLQMDRTTAADSASTLSTTQPPAPTAVIGNAESTPAAAPAQQSSRPAPQLHAATPAPVIARTEPKQAATPAPAPVRVMPQVPPPTLPPVNVRPEPKQSATPAPAATPTPAPVRSAPQSPAATPAPQAAREEPKQSEVPAPERNEVIAITIKDFPPQISPNSATAVAGTNDEKAAPSAPVLKQVTSTPSPKVTEKAPKQSESEAVPLAIPVPPPKILTHTPREITLPEGYFRDTSVDHAGLPVNRTEAEQTTTEISVLRVDYPTAKEAPKGLQVITSNVKKPEPPKATPAPSKKRKN